MRLRFLQWRNHGKKNKRRGLCFAVVLEELFLKKEMESSKLSIYLPFPVHFTIYLY